MSASMHRIGIVFVIVTALAMGLLSQTIGGTANAAELNHPGLVATDQETTPVENSVTEEIDAHGGTTDFWVRFDAKADLSGAASIVDWDERGEYVYGQLTATAKSTQEEFVADVVASGGTVEQHWISNSVLVKGGAAEQLDIARTTPGVDAILAPHEYETPEPISPTGDASSDALSVDGIAWGVDNVRAPEAWDAFDARGEGITVASIDTGVQFDHPALLSHYRGAQEEGTIDHNYNWFDATGEMCPDAPCDEDGHGTHTMGTIVGQDEARVHQIGVAPEATWISTNGCAAVCSISNLTSSGEWLLAPTDLAGNNPRAALRPHIINNSWGTQIPTNDPIMEDVLHAWEAAGIFSVWSNGNNGPFCGSSGSPGSRSITYSVGAYDINNSISLFSSRGPGQDGEIKPNIAAPGANVLSALPGDEYGTNSGTSMAAPHVAGAVALMWSAAPDLIGDVDATRVLLDQSAIDVDNTSCGGDAGDNNVWGEGRLDAYAAVDYATKGATGTVSGTVTDATSGASVPDATVSIEVHGQTQTVQTDSEGTYILRFILVGQWPMQADAATYSPSPRQPIAVVEGETTVNNFSLKRQATLSGVVTDEDSGRALPGATVESLDPDVRAVTDETGAYSMALKTGRHTIAVQAPGYARLLATVTVKPGDNDYSPTLLALPEGAVWAPGNFGPGLDDNVLATTVWDDGAGAALYAGGLFRTAGDDQVNRVARWDGTNWSSLSGAKGTGLNGTAHAIVEYEGDLIVAGSFTEAGGIATNRVARWDGSEWSPLGDGIDDRSVHALAVYDGELIAAGTFTQAGGAPASRIARWDGSNWRQLGVGVDSGTVFALDVYDGKLIVGGNFFVAGAKPANRIATWDGREWATLGDGLQGPFGTAVNALTIYDGDLVAGGGFTQAQGEVVNRIARWNGTTWAPFRTGSTTGMANTVAAMTVHNNRLVAGGAFTTAGGVTVNRIASWDGNQWAALSGTDRVGVDGMSVLALTVYDEGIMAAGAFGNAGGVPVNKIARWDGSRWSALAHGEAAGSGLDGTVHAVTWHEGQLVVGGQFTQAGGEVVNHVARWDGQGWQPFGDPTDGPGLNHNVWDLTVYRGDLYAAGQFTAAEDGTPLSHVARWDGTRWQALGGQVEGLNNNARALEVLGSDLIVGGQFTQAGGLPANRLARWDGNTWSAVGSGVNGGSGIAVWDLLVHQGELFAGGQFTQAGEVTVNNIARWDGEAWSGLAGESGTGVNSRVQTVTAYDDELVLGGSFTEAGGIAANWLARWDGSQWSAFDSQLNGGCCAPFVRSLTVHEGKLIAGGVFTHAGDGLDVGGVAAWNGREWSPLDGPAGVGASGGLSATDGGGPATEVWALETSDPDGDGLIPEQLLVGGSFAVTGGVPNWGLATYRAPIGLSVESVKERGMHYADLGWAGATSPEIDVYINGALVDTTANDGTHRVELGKPKPAGTEVLLWVCEEDTDACSDAKAANY